MNNKNLKSKKNKNFQSKVIIAFIIFSILYYIIKTFGITIFIILIVIFIILFKNLLLGKSKNTQKNNLKENIAINIKNISNQNQILINEPQILPNKKIKLEKRKRYLHIALNNNIKEAKQIISNLPISDRILIEVGTPLIKIYGAKAISIIKKYAPPGAYIVADNKCSDLALKEIEIMTEYGADALTCLGVAPIETINTFVEECEKFGVDSIIDMMNVSDPFSVLKKLKKLPKVVMLHRGVDETEFSKEKQIPYYQIRQIKGNYNVLVAVAGGDTIKEIQTAVLNDADIVVVWKKFYQSSEATTKLVKEFLNEIK
jgi:3-keto-L-gulonate-6-phosphate decarboxylase